MLMRLDDCHVNGGGGTVAIANCTFDWVGAKEVEGASNICRLAGERTAYTIFRYLLWTTYVGQHDQSITNTTRADYESFDSQI
jgi:hypothetical protein